MPILNYTTEVDAWKTVNEIQKTLAKHKVTHFSIKNEGSFPIGLSFTIDYKGQPLNFLLPSNYKGVFQALKRDRDVPPKSKNEEQALKVSWRIVKNWVDAQLAMVEAELATIQEVFMQYLIINSTGETLSQKILNGDGMKLLN